MTFRRGLAILATAALLPTASALASARAMTATHYPVMGCMNYRDGLTFLSHSPASCSVARNRAPFPLPLRGRYDLTHIRWRHWGSPSAGGTGVLRFGGSSLLSTHATLRVFGLLPASNPRICELAGGAYSKLRVAWKGVRGGFPAGQHVFDVTPIDAGC
jgi:hypothetical protein